MTLSSCNSSIVSLASGMQVTQEMRCWWGDFYFHSKSQGARACGRTQRFVARLSRSLLLKFEGCFQTQEGKFGSLPLSPCSDHRPLRGSRLLACMVGQLPAIPTPEPASSCCVGRAPHGPGLLAGAESWLLFELMLLRRSLMGPSGAFWEIRDRIQTSPPWRKGDTVLSIIPWSLEVAEG